MKNQKGFTLIELVIAIGLLSIFAITIGVSLNRTFKTQKQREQKEFTDKVRSSANLYVTNNGTISNDLSKDKGFVTITVEDLINDGYISENTIDPNTNEKIDKTIKIKVSYDANGTIKIDFPYDKEDDYLQALDVYVNLGDDSITDYCFYDLGSSTLSYVDSETGNFDHNYITAKGSDGKYQNINCEKSKIIYTSQPGTYRVTYSYKLKDNNVWKRKTRNVIVVDNVPPKCSITGNREDNAEWRYAGLTNFWVGCIDRGGCLSVTQPSSPLINMATKDVIISDKSGNKTTCTLNVYSDQIAPVCTQTNAPTTWTNQSRTITSKCVDTLSGCVEETTSKLYEGNIEKQTIYVSDKAGNKGNCTLNILIDVSPPIVKLSTLSGENFSAVIINATVQDSLSGVTEYQFSTNANLTESSPGWTTIAANKNIMSLSHTVTTLGSSTWYFYAKDAAGNMTKSSALTVKVITPVPDAPTLNISNPYQVRKGGTVNGIVKWTAGQEVSAYCVQLSSAAAPTASSSCWTTVATNTSMTTKYITLNGDIGKYYYVAYVKNTSGKISAASEPSYGEVIDTTPTAPKLSISPYIITTGGSITANVTWTANQSVMAYCVLKQGSSAPTVSSSCWHNVSTIETTGSYSFTLSGSPGKYYYVAYVKNNYGEISPASNADYGQINATKPTTPKLSTSTTATTVGNKATLTATWTSGQDVNAYCIQSSSASAPTSSSSCWVSTSSSSGTKSVTFSSAGTYSYVAYVKNTSNLISSASNTVSVTVSLADVNQYGDKYYCWYVTYSNGKLIVNTKDDASTLESSLICRDKPSGSTNIYNILKYSSVSYSDYWGESDFYKEASGTHTYGWYRVTGSVDPSGTSYSIGCYAAFYYTSKDCSECVNNNQCTTTRTPR